MAKAQKATRIGADKKRHLENVAWLKQVPGRFERVQAKRLERLRRNHPEKAHA